MRAHVELGNDFELSTFGHNLGFQAVDNLHLCSTAALRVKLVTQPLLRKSSGKLLADDSLAHTQNLGIIAQNRALYTEAVVCCYGSDALDLVGGDGHAESSAADQKGTIGLAVSDHLCSGGGSVRIRRLVGALVATNVLDKFYSGILLEVCLDRVFVLDAGLLF